MAILMFSKLVQILYLEPGVKGFFWLGQCFLFRSDVRWRLQPSGGFSALFASRSCSLTHLSPRRTSFMPSVTGRRPEVVSSLPPELWLAAGLSTELTSCSHGRSICSFDGKSPVSVGSLKSKGFIIWRAGKVFEICLMEFDISCGKQKISC